MAEPQRIRREDCRRRSRVSLARKDVDDHVGRVDALRRCSGAGGFDRRQPIREHGGQSLPPDLIRGMATIWRSPSSDPASLRRTRSSAAGSTQSLNGAPLRSAPGLRARTGTWC
jgi:hypothetical protein